MIPTIGTIIAKITAAIARPFFQPFATLALLSSIVAVPTLDIVFAGAVVSIEVDIEPPAVHL